jgi:ABC-type nickel/cobalt efflux system permease component RcnA
MAHQRSATKLNRHLRTFLILTVMLFFPLFSVEIAAHPLGNFTINHFARIEAGGERVRLRYVIDMAEIPTFQESQLINTDADSALSPEELNAYLERVIPQYQEGLHLTVDNQRLALRLTAKAISLPVGAGGLPTLRIECDFEGDTSAGTSGGQHHLRFEDTNQRERIGWHEIVVVPASGTTVFKSTAFGSAITDELKAYPQDMLVAPLNERTAEFYWTQGTAPSGASVLRMRDGRPVEQTTRDRFAELIDVKELTPVVALLGLLVAACLGALHAFSPGHGKTVVGAYLVGSRGTARHAAFLGLTVTLTHTSSVFALGLATLFASQYVVPERLYPILSLISGALVLVIGLSLFIQRLRGALGYGVHVHTHQDDEHTHEHAHEHGHAHHHDELHPHEHAGDAHQHEHTHDHDEAALHTHSHGGREHSHLPPGTDGSPVTWRSLLALGISGGLLPCPSALVVLLSAISLHRVGYGLALVLAFSVGLAATLTGIGLLFVYAGRFIKRSIGDHALVRVIPVLSAFVIACVGALICYEAFTQSGTRLSDITGIFFSHMEQTSFTSLGAFAVLGLGLVFGLKHATEVDHVVAVSTIVSQHRHLGRAALVGGLWGIGHTISLILVGAVVLMLRVAIPERVANWLEFCVALMIIGLGLNALLRALQGKRARLHVHQHTHDGLTHAHVHFHEGGTEHAPAETVAPHSHTVSRLGIKPLLVGAMHGLAGSATLTLLVLTQINSALLGLLYLTVFGIGSIFGMLLMSFLVGLPFALSARRLSGVNYGLQAAAGILSVAFGLWYAYETGIANGLL